MKLSVLICVYNTAKEYLAECLDSITRSTLRDYEICMVDDGSTVDYSELVSSYGLKYVKTENRGILAARLRCIEMAEGEYSVFVDSDDTVSCDFHQPMVETADWACADIVMNDWAFRTERARYYCLGDSTVSGHVSADGEEVLVKFLSQEGREHSYFVLWNKIYRSELLKSAARCVESSFLMSAPSVYAEDALINFFAFRDASRLRNIHTGYYFYRIHSSQSVNVSGREKLLTQINLMSMTLDTMADALPNTELKNAMLASIKKWGELMSRTHYSYALSAGYSDIYDAIKAAYRVEKLKRSTMRDQSAYVNNRLLASNFEEIDGALLKIWGDAGVTEVCYDKRDSYVRAFLERLALSGRKIVYSPTASESIPRAEISLKNKILHNYYIYNIGLILFKKGSRLRALLKKKL